MGNINSNNSNTNNNNNNNNTNHINNNNNNNNSNSNINNNNNNNSNNINNNNDNNNNNNSNNINNNNNKRLSARCEKMPSQHKQHSTKEYRTVVENLQDVLRSKSIDYECLEARYEEQERLVEFLSTSLKYENSGGNDTNDAVLKVLEVVERRVSGDESQQRQRQQQQQHYFPHDRVHHFQTSRLRDG